MRHPSQTLRVESAEQAYLFRHAVLRDVAYHLQLPGDRARLHRLTLAVIEEHWGRPALPAIDGAFAPHPTDAFALELAEHARHALAHAPDSALRESYCLYLARAAEAAEAGFRNDEALACWQQSAQALEGRARALARHRAAALCFRTARMADAERGYGEALAELGPDDAGAALVQASLGLLFERTGRVAQAEQCYSLAHRAHESRGNTRQAAIALARLARLRKDAGAVGEAEDLYRKALGVLQSAGASSDEGVLLSNLAMLLLETGRPREAEPMFERALATSRVAGDRRSVGATLNNLAELYQDTGRPEQARGAFEAALAVHREVGNRLFEAMALGGLATLQADASRFDEAEALYERSVAISREANDPRTAGITLGNWGLLHLKKGEAPLARLRFEEALALHARVRNRFGEAAHACGLGLALLAMGEADAHAVWTQGAKQLIELGDACALERVVQDMRRACAAARKPPFELPLHS